FSFDQLPSLKIPHSIRATAPPSGASPSQRFESLSRVLDAASLRLRVEIARLRRIAERSICAPFLEHEWVVGFRKRTACLRIARSNGTRERDPPRADISLAKQDTRAGHQPCDLTSILRVRLDAASSGCRGYLVHRDRPDRVDRGLLV